MVSGQNQQVKRRVFVVGKHPIVRQQLAALIRYEADLEVCGDAPDVPTALLLIHQYVPDVVVLDLSSKRFQGLEFLKQLKTSYPELRILVFSLHSQRTFMEQALQAGANDFLTAQEAAAKILPAIRSVLEGSPAIRSCNDALSSNVCLQFDSRLSDPSRTAGQGARSLPLRTELVDKSAPVRATLPPPQISVVMPVWNGERYLKEAVESVLAQTFTNFELIVVDDGSTDRTPEILAGCDDPRLRVFQLPHSGIVRARNWGVAQARAPWIAVQDADDISLPHRLETQWRAVNRKPNTVLCYTDVEYIGGKSNGAGRAKFPRTQAFLALKLCFQCAIVHSTTLFKKEAFLAAGGYADEDWEAVEDYGLWGRLIRCGGVAGIPEKLVKLRLHETSSSIRLSNEQKAAAQRIATAHCQRLMRLSSDGAQRAQVILSIRPHERPWFEWWWFLARCVPRLPWRSAEAYAWLALQTFKQLLAVSQLRPGMQRNRLMKKHPVSVG